MQVTSPWLQDPENSSPIASATSSRWVVFHPSWRSIPKSMKPISRPWASGLTWPCAWVCFENGGGHQNFMVEKCWEHIILNHSIIFYYTIYFIQSAMIWGTYFGHTHLSASNQCILRIWRHLVPTALQVTPTLAIRCAGWTSKQMTSLLAESKWNWRPLGETFCEATKL